MPESIESLTMKIAQQGQIIDQYRNSIYKAEVRFELLIKMLEEKKFFAKGEYGTRFPIYLKNDIGVIGPDGVMEGSLKISLYENQ
jgi:hypothetical protein